MRKFLLGENLYRARIRLAWISLIFFICLVFLWLKIVPGGHIVYQKDYSQSLRSGQGFIYNFTPQDRVDEVSGTLPRAIGDPLYFSVHTPRRFSNAKVTLSYYRHLTPRTPIVETGVLADSVVWRYNLKPIENRIIDNLKSSWLVLSEDPLVLQADNYYQNSTKFFDDLDRGDLEGCLSSDILNCLAVYNYNLDVQEKPFFYQADRAMTLEVPLRGTHSMFFYVDKGGLDVNFDFVDLNLDSGPDPISLVFSRGQEIISIKELDDVSDGEVGSGEEIRSLGINMIDLEPGVYKLEVKISDDVVIKKIESSTDRMVFSQKLWPVSWNEDIEVYTDASYLFAKALGPASLQEIKYGNETFSISEPYFKHEFSLSNPEGVNKVVLDIDDVILETNSVFSFSKNNFFNPTLKKVDRYFQPTSNIKYIIADYQSPSKTSVGLLENTVEFDLKNAYRQDGKYNFALSIPGLEEEKNGYLEIEKIEIEFTGRTIWQKIFNF